MKQHLYRNLVLLTILMIAWLLWSGLYTPLLIGLGVLSSLLALYIANRMGALEKSAFSLHLIPRLPGYWWWLLREITISSIDVARIVLSPRLPISPTVVTLSATSASRIEQAILGNAITLTPGTVTLDVHQKVLTVHCLTGEGAAALLSGEMNQRAAALTDY